MSRLRDHCPRMGPACSLMPREEGESNGEVSGGSPKWMKSPCTPHHTTLHTKAQLIEATFGVHPFPQVLRAIVDSSRPLPRESGSVSLGSRRPLQTVGTPKILFCLLSCSSVSEVQGVRLEVGELGTLLRMIQKCL